jgi:hypothetical protein
MTLAAGIFSTRTSTRLWWQVNAITWWCSETLARIVATVSSRRSSAFAVTSSTTIGNVAASSAKVAAKASRSVK